MKIEIRDAASKTRKFLAAEAILRFLATDDDKLGTLIMCKPEDVELIASDYNIYEALGSIAKDDKFDMNKLRKFFEVVDIVSYKEGMKKEKPILTHERVDEIRKAAFKNK